MQEWRSGVAGWLTCAVVAPPAGEEDVGRHPEHAAGHDGAGRLRRVTELHSQPVVRVGQVQRVGRIPEQTQPGQETSQSAGDRALLLQCEGDGEWSNFRASVSH